MTGYLHASYAAAFSEFGTPVHLPNSDGWVLQRAVPNSGHSDLMGCYPLFCCERWSEIGQDLEALQQRFVSLVLVADPLGDYSQSDLSSAFHLVRPFKHHLIVDYRREQRLSRHHRYYSRRAQRTAAIQVETSPSSFASEFASLYNELIRRHQLSGLKAFSHRSLAAQMAVPGAVLFRALQNGHAVAAHLWMVQGDTAYSHLLASNDLGYAISASYALYAAAIEYFATRVRYLDLGSGAGVNEDRNGLYSFKAGWANDSRTAYLCGMRLNEPELRRLTLLSSADHSDYFPAYRSGELTTSELQVSR